MANLGKGSSVVHVLVIFEKQGPRYLLVGVINVTTLFLLVAFAASAIAVVQMLVERDTGVVQIYTGRVL